MPRSSIPPKINLNYLIGGNYTERRIDTASRDWSTVTASNPLPNGALYVSCFTAPCNFLCSNFNFEVVTPISSGTTTLLKMCLVSLNSDDAGFATIGQSNSDTTLINSSGMKTLTLISPYQLRAGLRYGVGLIALGSSWNPYPYLSGRKSSTRTSAGLSPRLVGWVNSLSDVPNAGTFLNNTGDLHYFWLT